ncbi:hypothetical protein [Anaeromyxobacter sp. Fw109-5]|uniref:hypothetical protein n=1 Tax=Anaeromyxobacter sp. (strain Fw109-5) TaxID=404589 RepID=UPI00117DE8F9|nr:hypothetical protein [Anaeromyxobacter sp. Fw109-5]
MRGLFLLGSTLPHPAAFAGAPTTGSIGYDGQYFGALATDPLLIHPGTADAIHSSVYRAGRIGLPLVAWLLAAGNASAAIHVYQALCWALAIVGVWLVARWIEDEGSAALWAAPLVVSAGLVSSMVSSLPDGAAVALVVLALWLHQQGRGGVPLVLTFACLVRETSYIAALAVAVAEVRAGRWARALAAVIAPAAVVLGWRRFVVARLGQADSSGDVFEVPFSWVARRFSEPFPPSEVLGFLALVLAAMAAIVSLPRLVARVRPELLAFVGFVVLTALLPYAVYEGVWSYARVTLALPFLAVAVAEGEEDRWRRRLFRAVPATFALAGIAKVLPEVLGVAVP